MFSKGAKWRRAANDVYWMVTEPRVLRVRLASLWAYWRAGWADTSHLTPITEADFRSSRKSDRVFLFGSGASLNAITPEEWGHIAEHDTFGFSMFVYQQWVRTDYHMLREMYVMRELERDFWLPYSQEFVHYFDTNPHFDNTILLAQSGWRSLTVNRMLALGMFQKPRRILRFRVKEGYQNSEPTFSLKEGIVHGSGSLTDAINLAVIGGWKHIILTGVDLYNACYFWEDAHINARDFGRDPNAIHNTVNSGIIEYIGHWNEILLKHDIHLWVYNPQSLLARVLPVYNRHLQFSRQGHIVGKRTG